MAYCPTCGCAVPQAAVACTTCGTSLMTNTPAGQPAAITPVHIQGEAAEIPVPGSPLAPQGFSGGYSNAPGGATLPPPPTNTPPATAPLQNPAGLQSTGTATYGPQTQTGTTTAPGTAGTPGAAENIPAAPAKGYSQGPNYPPHTGQPVNTLYPQPAYTYVSQPVECLPAEKRKINYLTFIGLVVSLAGIFVYAVVGYSFFPLPLAGAIFSAAGLGTFKPETQKHRWMAVVGLILSIALVLLSCAIFLTSFDAEQYLSQYQDLLT